MSRGVHLTIATTDHDYVRDFRLGDVRAEGIETTWPAMDIHEIFSRFTLNREWRVSELSFAKFIAQATRDDADMVGLPVYVSRMFRFSSFYVNKQAGIKHPRDLAGKRIGVSDWAQTPPFTCAAGYKMKSVFRLQGSIGIRPVRRRRDVTRRSNSTCPMGCA